MYEELILQLRAEGKTYDEISKITGAAKSTISYYCGKNQQTKSLIRNRRSRSKQHPFIDKLYFFKNRKNKLKTDKSNKSNFQQLMRGKINTFNRSKDRKMYHNPTFTVQDVIDKFGKTPKCYLTGIEIDIYNTSSYHFDHIIPVSKGGLNTLDNLALCLKDANKAKGDMLLEDFIKLCETIVEHNKK